MLETGEPTERMSPIDPAATARPAHRHHPMARRVRRLCALALVVFLVVAGVSLGSALLRPGSDPTSARLAEWARDHGMGNLITWLEKVQYERNPPRVGGRPAGGIPIAGGSITTTAPRPSRLVTTPVDLGLPAPPALQPLASGAALPGEGQWQTVVLSHDQPAVRVTSLRPDSAHTSYLAGVMWIDPTFVRGQLRPGYSDPGGTWHAADSLTPAEQDEVAAAFNAGFRLTNDSSHGGYYSEGRTVLPLVNGAASLVLDNDGTATVGSWNEEVGMSSEVASVRQNLVMLVDNGMVNPTCGTGGQAEWGATIGQAAYIDRSGFGVTASGAEVYVGGPALSVCTLGNILKDAGVVRGMELDINPDWITGVYFHVRDGQQPLGFRLYPGQRPSPEHYLSPSSRDWYAWFLR